MKTFVFEYYYGAGSKFLVVCAETENRAYELAQEITKAIPDQTQMIFCEDEGVKYDNF